jgi:hypothetical protein
MEGLVAVSMAVSLPKYGATIINDSPDASKDNNNEMAENKDWDLITDCSFYIVC